VRAEGICSQCKDATQIAARGLCFRCYRQQQRSLDLDPWERPDKFAVQVQKAQQITRDGLVKIMNCLDKIAKVGIVPEEDIDTIRELLKPHVDKIGAPLKRKKTVTTFPETDDNDRTQ
jgi:hypothetical protein